MDKPTRAMAEYATALDFRALTRPAIDSTVRHVIDTIGCALGALDSRPARVARSVAATASSTFGASVFGLPAPTTPEYAAFANTAMVRFLDYNDTGIGGHPSDMIPAVLAVAEPRHAGGKDVIAAIFAAYEIVAGLRRGGMRLRDRHVDQVQATLGSAAGCGMILGLDLAAMANAISLAITPGIPLRVTRTGALSDWKGCATAHGAMTAVLAARWANEGLTGPPEPFEGIAGLYDLLRVGPFDLARLGQPSDGLCAVEATGFKQYPAEYSAQGPLAVILALRQGIDVDAITQVNIALPWGGWHEIGGGQGDREAKWNPSTRETADHSLPYLVAVALIDGSITPASFTDERIGDPALRALMRRIAVTEDPQLTREHAGELPRWPSVVEIVLTNGARIRRHSGLPKGHPRNPLSDAELEAKFLGLAEPAISGARARRLLDTLWDLERQADVGDLTEQFRELRRAGA